MQTLARQSSGTRRRPSCATSARTMIRREVQSRRWWKGCRQQGSRSPHRASSTFIGLQIEYSLLERTIEQELVPMALELGLGITPWSPLKSGALSGKYTRKNAARRRGTAGSWTLPEREGLYRGRCARWHRPCPRQLRRASGAVLGAGAEDVSSRRRRSRSCLRCESRGRSAARSARTQTWAFVSASRPPSSSGVSLTSIDPTLSSSWVNRRAPMMVGGSLRFRDREGQHALLSCPRSRRIFGARRGLSSWETRR
jgi:hypothetical protein